MDVYIQSAIGICSEYTDISNKRRDVSIVISPLKLVQDDSALKVNSGCNMWRACRNIECQFSLLNRGGDKKK